MALVGICKHKDMLSQWNNMLDKFQSIWTYQQDSSTIYTQIHINAY